MTRTAQTAHARPHAQYLRTTAQTAHARTPPVRGCAAACGVLHRARRTSP
jgi:hypothetical protein